MILVIGNTPQRVDLKDLDDHVYYKQQKIYTEVEYQRSKDLQKEIKKGTLTILKRTAETGGSFDVPTVGLPSNTVQPQSPQVSQEAPKDSDKIDALMERISQLEKTLTQKPAEPAAPVGSDAVSKLAEKVDKLEKDVSSSGSSKALEALCDTVSRLEKRLEKDSANDALIGKLEELISKGSSVSQSVSGSVKKPVRPDEVYVPNVTVEDANSHINLEVRKIERSDSVSDSLKKLKELKSKSK